MRSISRVRIGESVLKALIFLIIGIIIFFAIMTGSFKRAYLLYRFDVFAKMLSYPLMLYAVMAVTHLFYRGLFCFIYKPYTTDSGYQPTVTVIIPAYNEGEMVAKSLLSAVDLDYPKEKLEIICVDDGSRDDTWEYIQSIASKHPNLITAYQHKKNRGKRKALALGFRKATGEILVTMDSDSVMEKDALKNLVLPFEDAKVGAVTAKVQVYNRRTNLLTRILNVRYTMAFEFYRSSRSVFRTVFCCSGVLSAYRRELIMELLDKWLHQRFLGQECTYGDDRALTNMILKRGCETVYQKSAVVYTTVPETFFKFLKMITRWNKSFLRESFVFLTFMFTRYREGNRLLPIFDFTLSVLMLPFQFYILGYSLYYVSVDPILMFRFLALISIMGSVYMLFYIKFEKDTDFVYGIMYGYLHVFVGIWTLPYALLTIRNKSWLTR